MRGFAFLALVALASLMWACAPGQGRDSELTLWHSYRGAEAAALERAIERYNAQLPADAAKVRALAVPFDAYADKLSAALPRGRGPDMFIFAQDRLGGWAEAGDQLTPLGFWMDETYTARFLPGLTDALTYRGVIYAVPINFKSLALIRNRTLAAQAPRTSEDLVSAGQDFMRTREGAFGLAYEYANPDIQAAIMHGFGGGVFSDTGAPALNRVENARAFDLVLGWRDRQKILPSEPTGAVVLGLFNQAKTPFVISGPWFIGEVAPNIDVSVSPLPDISAEGAGPIRPWLLVEGLFITRASHDPKAAFAFATFLTRSDEARRLALEGRQLPSVAAVYDDPAIMNDPILSGFRAQLDRTTPLPNTPEMAMFWAPGDIATKQVFRGGRAPEAALAEAQTAMETALAGLRGAAEPPP